MMGFIPIDISSSVSDPWSKISFDATSKWPGEADREWGEPIVMNQAVKERVDELWDDLGL